MKNKCWLRKNKKNLKNQENKNFVYQKDYEREAGRDGWMEHSFNGERSTHRHTHTHTHKQNYAHTST